MGAYTTVRLDDELGRRLKLLAEQSGMTAGALARRLIEAALESGRIESNEAYALLYGRGDDRAALVALAHGWLPEGHPEVWRVYGRADGPWSAPNPGHGNDLDHLIAEAPVLTLYRRARERQPCASSEIAIAVAATSGLTQIVVEVDGDVDGRSIVGRYISRIILSGYFRGFRLPTSQFEISLRPSSGDVDGLVFTGDIIKSEVVRENSFLQFILALAIIGDPEWRGSQHGERFSSWPPPAWVPRVVLRVAAEESVRRGRGKAILYHRNKVTFSTMPEVLDAAEEAAHAILGNRFAATISAAADAGGVLYDEEARAASARLAENLLDWMAVSSLPPTALLDWVPCLWEGGVMSSLHRLTHHEAHHALPLLPEKVKDVANDFIQAELVRRAAVGTLLRRLLER